jgi:hypothetical protein
MIIDQCQNEDDYPHQLKRRKTNKENSATINNIICQVMWHEITQPSGKLPDESKHVLIYDGYEDDVVKGYIESNSLGGHDWINIESEWILKDPQWWAELPFPDSGHAAPKTDPFS